MVACASVLGLWPAADNRHALHEPLNPVPASASADAGRSLLVAYQCGACHHIDGVSGAQGSQGPALLPWRQRSSIAGRVPNTPDRLVAWIVDPAGQVPGTPMPNLGVTPRDARAMAAYLFRPE